MCQCRKCNHVFHQSEINRVHNDIYGEELRCPECGSRSFGLINFTYNNYNLSYEGVYKLGKFFKIK
ncbi:hypothetical protein SAMN02745217_04227 [Anaerocolumna xylanovorans DSM 12503]|uniref:Uncharacterized protein n=1 Tax=Anaerocolumna xylanovorans DSM 12503 TaxID=1121345 RepID=A0A1M7YM64_9FIRM|nr:hypothetical protein SAMN02745217_04227 [Anaerocolumna xylanovorans DSM 12503]